MALLVGNNGDSGDSGDSGEPLKIPVIPQVPDIPITYPVGIKNNTRATVGVAWEVGARKRNKHRHPEEGQPRL